jgi:hypothetical protein
LNLEMKTLLFAARRLSASAAILLALASLMMSLPWLARAQTADGVGESLAGTAARVQVSLAPGAAARGELRFTYDGTAPVNAHATVLDYRLGPDGPISQPPAESTPFSAANWITVTPATLELHPRAAETVRYRVQVPTDAASGDYNAEVLVETDSPGPRSGVRLIVNVPGEPRRQMKLLGFAPRPEPVRFLSYNITTNLPVYDGGPIQLRVQAQNDGAFIASVGGTVELVDQFGRTVSRLDLTPDQVLPGDVGIFNVTWPNPPPFGYVAARLRLEADGTPLEAETRLLVVPWQQVLAALLVLVALRLLLGKRFALPVRRQRQSAQAAQPAPATQTAAAPAGTSEPVTTWVGRGNQVVEAPTQPQEIAASPQNGTRPEEDPAELLLWGQRAARAGDRLVAHRLFTRVIDVEPLNEEAWLWRAGTSDDLAEATRCLERVIEMNPANERAQRGLAEIRHRAAEVHAE